MRRLHNPDARPWSIQAVIRRGDGIRLLVDTNSWLEWRVFFFGDYDPDTVSAVQTLLPPGAVALDIGANIGTHALAMARRVREAGTVIAFEPNPRIFTRLQANIALNPDCHIDARPVAISDHVGTIELFLPPVTNTNQGQASQSAHSQWQQVKAVCTTLDALALHRVDLIKIDIEGFESNVIAGGGALLYKLHPALIFEYDQLQWDRAGYQFEPFVERLRALGYDDFALIGRDKLKPLPAVIPRFINVLARKRRGP